MTGVYEVPGIVREGDFAVKIDLENGKIFYLDIEYIQILIECF